MILRDVDNIKVGSTSVNKVYQGGYKVYDKNKIALEGYCKQGVPSEYQQVEYIESTGTQWIHTGFPLFNYENHEIIMDFAPTAFFNYNSLFGSSYDADTFEGWIYANGDLRCRYNLVRYCNTDYSMTINTRYLLDIKKEGTTLSEYLNDSLIGTATTTNLLGNNNFYLLLSGSDYGKYKLYGCKLYSNGVLVRNFIPCYRKSDSVIGLYDLVNNVFYTNAGTGTFNKGADVPNPNYPQEIEVMEGKQVVNVKGQDFEVDLKSKNLIDILTLDVGYVGGLGNILTNDITNGVMHSEFIEVEPNTTYRFKIFETSSNYPNWFGVGLYSSNDENTFIERQTMTNTSQNYIQITTTSTTNYIRVSGRNLAEATKIMLYKRENLFDKDNESIINNRRISTSNGKGYLSTGYSITEYIEIKENKSYMLISGIQSYYSYYDSNKSYISGDIWNTGTSKIAPLNAKYIRFDFETSNINNIQFEEELAYEPYYNYKLAGIGDYKDNIYTKKGKWYVKSLLRKVVLDGSEGWGKSGASTSSIFVGNTNITNAIDGKGLSNLFIYSSQVGVWNFTIYNNGANLRLCVYNSTISTIEAFKTWLSTHNTEVYYVLATPTEEEITSPTLIQQLNRLYQAM